MAPREKLSIGFLSGEGPRSTAFIMALVTVVGFVAFAMGQWSTLVNACFGLRP